MHQKLLVSIIVYVVLSFNYSLFAQNGIEKIGQTYNYWDLADRIEVQGNYAYVATYRTGLQVIDISDPENLNTVAVHEISASIYDLTISDDLICVACYDTATFFQLIDISDPTELVLLSRIDSADSASVVTEMSFQDDLLFISISGRLEIYDISDPNEPSLESSTEIRGPYSCEFAVAGEFCFITEYLDQIGENILTLLDVSDPSNPQIVNEEVSDHYYDIFVRGEYAYFSSGSELTILDISNPEEPEDVGFINNDDQWEGFYISLGDGYVCLSGRQDIWLIDISDVANPTVGGIITDLYDPYKGFTATGDRVYVVDRAITMGAYDVTNLDEPELLGTYPFQGHLLEVEVADDCAYVLGDEDGLHVVDISNPANPVESSVLNTPGDHLNIALQDDFLYLANGQNGMLIIDISDSENPEVEGSTDAIYASNIVLNGDYLYASNSQSNVYIIDISDHTSPVIVDSMRTTYCVGNMYINSGRLYIICAQTLDFGMFEGQLRIYDISEPLEPQLLGTYETEHLLCEVVAQNDVVYIAYSEFIMAYWSCFSAVMSIDVSDPENPELIDQTDIKGSIEDLAMNEFNLVVGNSFCGIRVIDITNPRRLREKDCLLTPGSACGVAISDQNVYVADYTNLSVYNCSEAFMVEKSGTVFPEKISLLPVYPNPFNSTTTIKYSLPFLIYVSLCVYDPLGRQIGTLFEGYRQPGIHSTNLNAADLPSGLYFVKLNAGGQAFTQKVMLVK